MTKLQPGINDCASWCEKHHQEYLLEEWDKTNSLSPSEITFGSHKIIKWRCNKGHEWSASLYSRTLGHNNCPYCSGYFITEGFNDLKTYAQHKNLLYLCNEYDVEKNSLPMEQISAMSHTKVWWKCPKGHSYQSSPANRTKNKSNCPVCSHHRIVAQDNDLKSYCQKHNYWNLIQEYDSNKNRKQMEKLAPASQEKVWWKCSLGHEFQATVQNRVLNHSKCPYCANKKTLTGYNDLQTNNYPLSLEFDEEKNQITTDLINYRSTKKYWWKCPHCGNSYYASVYSKNILHSRCPICANRQLKEGFNDLYSWSINNDRIDIIQDWDYNKNKTTPQQILKNTKTKYWFICPKCHRSYQASIVKKTQINPTMCPYCSNQKSIIELTIFEFLKNFVDETAQSGQKFWKKEIDIYSPKLNLYLEYDGWYFHNNDSTLKNSEIQKNYIFQTHQTQLIRIKETKQINKNLIKQNTEFGSIYYIFFNGRYDNKFFYNLSILLNTILSVPVSDVQLQKLYHSLKIKRIHL